MGLQLTSDGDELCYALEYEGGFVHNKKQGLWRYWFNNKHHTPYSEGMSMSMVGNRDCGKSSMTMNTVHLGTKVSMLMVTITVIGLNMIMMVITPMMLNKNRLSNHNHNHKL
jgi:hypothetical protein